MTQKEKFAIFLLLIVILVFLFLPLPYYGDRRTPCPLGFPKDGATFPCPPPRKGWIWNRPLFLRILDNFTVKYEESSPGQSLPGQTSNGEGIE